MSFETCPIDDALIYTPTIHGDERGYFFESFSKRLWQNYFPKLHFVQDNQARSSYGVIRGLHYQVAPYGQAKLIRVIEGEIIDVIVDLRTKSKSYGEHYSIILSAQNNKQLFIPKGFAHGYVALSDTCLILYKCDNYYFPDHEAGIKFDDASLGINWEIHSNSIVLSQRDQQWPSFAKHIPYLSE